MTSKTTIFFFSELGGYFTVQIRRPKKKQSRIEIIAAIIVLYRVKYTCCVCTHLQNIEKKIRVGQ